MTTESYIESETENEYLELTENDPRYTELQTVSDNTYDVPQFKSTSNTKFMNIKPKFLILLVFVLSIVLLSVLSFAIVYVAKNTSNDVNKLSAKNTSNDVNKSSTKSSVLWFPRVVSECLSEWKTAGTYCFKEYSQRKTWQEANYFCKSFGADLLSLHTQKETEILLKSIDRNGYYWIGLNDIATEGQYDWSDGSVNNYTNWRSNQPDDYKRIEDCIHLYGNSGLWNDHNCFVLMKFLCKIERAIQCGHGNWYLFNNSCYTFYSPSSYIGMLSWNDAKQYCKDLGADLVHIQSQNEDNFLRSIITNDTKLWIGQNDVEGGNVGFQNCEATNGYPNIFWTNSNCNDKNGFICEKRL